MKRNHRLWLAPALLLLTLVTAPRAQEATPAEPLVESPAAAAMSKLLEGTGLAHNKIRETVWTVPFKGEVRKDFNVVVALVSDGSVVVLFAVLAEKAQMKASPELWQQLLRMNDQFDRVKVGIDGDGDAFVRVDLSLRVLDPEELKANLEQVAAATDEILAAIQPHLVPAPPAPATPATPPPTPQN